MTRFVVRKVTKQEQLTIVVLEPVRQALLLEDTVPPGCIQHTVSVLLENKDSEADINKICDILSNVYMDDSTSRKSHTHTMILFVSNEETFFFPHTHNYIYTQIYDQCKCSSS